MGTSTFHLAANRVRSAFLLLLQAASETPKTSTPNTSAVPRLLSSAIPGLSLSSRCAFAAAIVLCNGMALLGGWVVTQIERGLLQNAAQYESAFIQDLLEPIALEIIIPGQSANTIGASLGALLTRSPMEKRLKSIAIWLPDGSIIYSTDTELIGKKFPLSADVKAAFGGAVRTDLWNQRFLGLYRTQPIDGAVRVVYTPLREMASTNIVAVVETADNADALKGKLAAVRMQTWVVVGVATLLMILLLFGVVHQGSRTIDRQQSDLERQFNEQARLVKVNMELSERLREANWQGIELGEQAMRRIGSDLHGGPAQLLALALMRMYELRPVSKKSTLKSEQAATPVLDVIEQAAAGALKEIRDISANLVLPELQKLTPAQAIGRVIQAHEHATGTPVECDIATLPDRLTLPVLICIFRFIQEALSNAYRHAGGVGQKVTAQSDETGVSILVSDGGPGFSVAHWTNLPGKFGLRGLRQRVESIGGTFEIRSSEGQGTKILLRLPHPPQQNNSMTNRQRGA